MVNAISVRASKLISSILSEVF